MTRAVVISAFCGHAVGDVLWGDAARLALGGAQAHHARRLPEPTPEPNEAPAAIVAPLAATIEHPADDAAAAGPHTEI